MSDQIESILLLASTIAIAVPTTAYLMVREPDDQANKEFEELDAAAEQFRRRVAEAWRPDAVRTRLRRWLARRS